MPQPHRNIGLVACSAVMACCALMAVTSSPARAASVELINFTVLVTDAESGQPINQARLTLQFREAGDKWKLKRSKLISYSAKTNTQGRYKFVEIPEGTIRLIVTDEQHQTFSKDFNVSKANSVIEVKLKKPHPLL